ncbi:MAG: AI-2E family transporter [Cyclobacteriaceae bacterium]|nr:MAG: AI-2E family transporter [Cyclobacteriaceae bacterium]
MNSEIIARGILKAVGVLAVIVILGYLIYKVQSVIAYITIAAVVALIGRPIVDFLRRKLKLPDTLSIITTMLAMLGLLVGIIGLYIPLLAEHSENLSLLNIDRLVGEISLVFEKLSQYFGASPKVVEQIVEEVEMETAVIDELHIGMVPKVLNILFEIFSSAGVGIFSVLFISFFLLKDSNLIQNVILVLVPKSEESKIVNSLAAIKNLLSRYFIGLLLQQLILFLAYTTTLLLVGVEKAVLIAFLCALFNVIPYIGPIMGGFTMIVLTMTSDPTMDFGTVVLPMAGYVLLGVIIGQLIDNFFSQPFIFSNSVKSHPLEIFLIIVTAGLLFGILGMIIAVPAYTALKVILKEFMGEHRMVKALTNSL